VPTSFSASTVALLTAVAAVVGAAISGVVQWRSALDLEQMKFESNLILRALESETPIKTLKFFADAGLIPNHKQDVLKLAGEPSTVPQLRNKLLTYKSLQELLDKEPGLIREEPSPPAQQR
jgi:hypothetical protein